MYGSADDARREVSWHSSRGRSGMAMPCRSTRESTVGRLAKRQQEEHRRHATWNCSRAGSMAWLRQAVVQALRRRRGAGTNAVIARYLYVSRCHVMDVRRGESVRNVAETVDVMMKGENCWRSWWDGSG